MDLRWLIMLIPLLAALTWAFYNIGKLALEQWKRTGTNA
uniref:Photosystem II reaction center protein Y n=2 Tax=Glaucocystis TaxID=38258 RepID=A0A3G1IV97_9EUKA|nr:photosystem II protein Y [Glaucocystis incrassata]ASQ39940.1 photosystem II protein Y [Glaucocystis sp. BBH]ASQ39965.1 photosystem II protein Y [Glaucocystis incrassata]